MNNKEQITTVVPSQHTNTTNPNLATRLPLRHVPSRQARPPFWQDNMNMNMNSIIATRPPLRRAPLWQDKTNTTTPNSVSLRQDKTNVVPLRHDVTTQPPSRQNFVPLRQDNIYELPVITTELCAFTARH